MQRRKGRKAFAKEVKSPPGDLLFFAYLCVLSVLAPLR